MHDGGAQGFRENFVGGLRSLTALGLVLLVTEYFDLNTPGSPGGSLFSLGFLVLAGTAGGRIAALVGLPKLTGYLIAGLLSGPAVSEIVSRPQVENLSLVNSLALALIALQAGCEFTNQMLRNNFKSIVYGSFSHLIVMAIGITALVYFVSSFFGFLGDYKGVELLALSALIGAVAVAKSPAAVMAVLGETKPKGPLTDHAVGIVVLLDVIVLVLFSLILVLARSVIDPLVGFDMSQLSHLAEELLASVAAGCTFGLMIACYFRLIGKEKILFVLVAAYGISALCRYFQYDTMLVFVVAGYIVTNLSKQGKSMVHTIESMSSLVMIVFFATAGASLHLEYIMGAWELVLIIFVGRTLLTWVSAQTGHRLADDQGVVRKYGYTPFVSQAGLAIGLTIIISGRLPGVGDQIAAIAISVIALNEIVGPAIFKWGLQRAGEIGRKSHDQEMG